MKSRIPDATIKLIKETADLRKYLQKAKNSKYGGDKNGYICPDPDCGSGTGKHGHCTGGVSINDNHTWHCYACGAHGDVIKAVQLSNHVDFVTACEILCRDLYIPLIDPSNTSSFTSPVNASPKKPVAPAATDDNDNQPKFRKATKAELDYRDACNSRLKNKEESEQAITFFVNRHIDLGLLIDKYKLGFDPRSNPSNHGVFPRIIIPAELDSPYYVARDISGKAELRYDNPKGIATQPFNLNEAYDTDKSEIYICEGIFDALSLLSYQFCAVSINSASNANRLIYIMKSRPTEPIKDKIFVILTDNDEAGEAAKQKIIAGLRELNLHFYVPTRDFWGECKDVNELAVKLDGKQDGLFFDRIFDLREKARESYEQGKKPYLLNDYLEKSFIADIQAYNELGYQTGFPILDEKIGGGLRSDFITIGAGTSVGKTSFIHQIVDTVARNGKDVLFFEFDVSDMNFASRSFSRFMSEQYKEVITTRRFQEKTYDTPQYEEMLAWYMQNIGNRVSLISNQGNQEDDIKTIIDITHNYCSNNGTRPLVVIDYLQCLTYNDIKSASEKDRYDQIINQIYYNLVHPHNYPALPVIVISSINRGGYYYPIGQESFKETGNLEYRSEILFGLQFKEIFTGEVRGDESGRNRKNMAEVRHDYDNSMAKTPRDLVLNNLKNKNGPAGWALEYRFDPCRNTFYEIGEFYKKSYKKPEGAKDEDGQVYNYRPAAIAEAEAYDIARQKQEDGEPLTEREQLLIQKYELESKVNSFDGVIMALRKQDDEESSRQLESILNKKYILKCQYDRVRQALRELDLQQEWADRKIPNNGLKSFAEEQAELFQGGTDKKKKQPKIRPPRPRKSKADNFAKEREAIAAKIRATDTPTADDDDTPI